jgi:hypothetical protein
MPTATTSEWEVIRSPIEPHLAQLVASARQRVTAVSPFVTRYGARVLLRHCQADRLLFLTAPRGRAVLERTVELEALREIMGRGGDTVIQGLTGLHAKVYLADSREALITSANLTEPGLSKSFEYGVILRHPTAVSRIWEDVQSYWSMGFVVTAELLDRMAERMRALANLSRSIATAERGIRRLARELDDECVRARIRDRSLNAILARTVLDLLRLRGPLSTAELHPLIQALHPDICDDSVDRVIDGQRFGKLWKHMVRNAQQWLKGRGELVLEQGRWRAVP